MQVHNINFAETDESAVLQYNLSMFYKFLGEADESLSVSISVDENNLDTEIVSILNLPSLKRGNMTTKTPSTKLELILCDKQRLCSWIENYKNRLNKSFEKDSVQIATLREAATRLKMLLDDSDFDDGKLRNERRKAIMELNDMLSDFSEL